MPLGFPYRKARIGQVEASNAVSRAVREHGVLLLQAPTGFGKTITILYGLVRAGMPRTLYVVRTRNELAQPFREARRLGVKPAALYSKKAMCPLLGGSEDIGFTDFWNNCRLLRRRHMCPYYEKLHDIDAGKLWDTVFSSETPFHLVEKLASIGVCPYYALRILAGSADIVVSTYPYVFNPYIRDMLIGEEGLEDYVLVVDEAHSLQSIADLAERTLSENKARWAVKELGYYGISEDAVERLEELQGYIEREGCGRGYRHVDKAVLESILGDPAYWFELANEIRRRKMENVGGAVENARVRIHTLSVGSFAEALGWEGYEAFLTCRAGKTGVFKVLSMKPIDPSIPVRDVFEHAKAIILSSGTLPPPDYFRDVLGVNRKIMHYDVEEIHGPVFPPENRVTLILTYATSKYTKRSKNMFSVYAGIIEALWDNLPGGVFLIVYPSYEFMKNVVLSITERIDMIVEKEDTTISSVVLAARERDRLIVNSVAGGKLTEGIEILSEKGESLIKTVVIAGIPYPLPDDYMELTMRNLASRIGGERAWSHVFFDTATTRVRQALGRAVRSPRDRALFILADYRFMDPRILKCLRVRVNKIITSHRGFIQALKQVKDYLY